ncbi:hypothetical protein CERSUDRAFT_121499 [Gelatoporia subvermispora B]|uniref:VWFA domain-containing protein n=1 Tax=Ceriporiopsis subvermispora (strain B) TaxID=914234 RepID=M2QUW2_CERS8|nr:hypothetical protein CERSUDRAFT_121499 [Gelatoporia subvermispora B]
MANSFIPSPLFPDDPIVTLSNEHVTDATGAIPLDSASSSSVPPGGTVAVEQDTKGSVLAEPDVEPPLPRAPKDGGPHSLDSSRGDLVHRVKGLYRILDLISEQGSGGLVDKVVIAQEHLQRLMNSISPGVYTSLTKVDFTVFDKVTLHLLGIYGSKSEIVRFLVSMNAVNAEIANMLLQPRRSEVSFPTLRSGLYVLRPSTPPEDCEKLYVIYWPEDTTWSSTSLSSVRKNRVTFMRYLTKLTDQIVCLISDEDEGDVVWPEDVEDTETEHDDDDEDSDRLFAFEVFKTNEQEENVVARTGFSIRLDVATHSGGTAPDAVDPVKIRPRLIAGETVQGILEAEYVPPTERVQPPTDEPMWPARLRTIIENESLHLSDSISSDTIAILLEHDLDKRAPHACRTYKQALTSLNQQFDRDQESRLAITKRNLEEEAPKLKESVRLVALGRVSRLYPTINPSHLEVGQDTAGQTTPDYKDFLERMLAMYPDMRQYLGSLLDSQAYTGSNRPFKLRKERILICAIILDQYSTLELEQQLELINAICDMSQSKSVASLMTELRNKKDAPSILGRFRNWFSISDESMIQLTEAQKLAEGMDDATFLAGLDAMVTRHPLLEDRAQGALKKFEEQLGIKISSLIDKTVKDVRRVLDKAVQWQIEQETQRDRQLAVDQLRVGLISEIKDTLLKPNDPHTLIIESIQKRSSYHGSLVVKVAHKISTGPVLRYTIHPLDLTADDKHSMQLDATFIPTPRMHAQSRVTFDLPANHDIIHIQLLQNRKVLLLINDNSGNVKVYMEPLSAIGDALKRGSACKKTLKCDKIGLHFLLAFDEVKRLLAVLSTSEQLEPRLQLHMFSFDETFASLQGMGTPMNLGAWYDRTTSVLYMSFVTGNEELVLVDNNPRARIFSFVTQQFRPATLHLQRVPMAICSSPDGSCLLTLDSSDEGGSMRAYHWATFGTTEGIFINLADIPIHSSVLTSIGDRNKVHFVALDLEERQCRSIALDITRKVTEFMFKETGHNSLHAHASETRTARHCFIDCHSEVWTRFPVVPAIRRQIFSSDRRQPKSLTFVASCSHDAYPRYFSDLITAFERSTRKPTGTELSTIIVNALDYDSFVKHVRSTDGLTAVRGGEWIVDMLCLIPIHLAITRDNRFIPLKDGVWSSDLERQLLGADVGRIVDALSFGWYESVFQSYMATKPVKVVSSMGEQSVGKSFALNHLVDTSFAGSAMRTTEGVWMAVTPLHDMLIVALDFEGVHSIERSAQEDTLLVLFNTAISNLVLFRNNFALSRDITGLFKSFQSSSSILDPAANPDLFQSTLAIIIKDVVESDKTEIIKEFSLKFQQIVQLEQGSNFITRLHRGRLDIVPWPVIESRQFYTLFTAFRKRLDKQATTYSGGSIFLQIIKTVMAKLKANDWGALSQNLVIHRAQLLQSVLPRALTFGAAEVVPDYEPLKNYDTGEFIEYNDSRHHLFLNEAESPDTHDGGTCDSILKCLIQGWSRFKHRSHESEELWVDELQQYLSGLVQCRIHHVEEWITQNIARFPENHPNIQALKRTVNTLQIDLKANVKVCALQCANCYLSCLQDRHHDGSHNCGTSHQCIHLCEFDEHSDESEVIRCGLSAGHPGKHVCDVTAHLCGKPCKLYGRPGCLGGCSKVVDHTDSEHICSATVHECGEPCSLADVRLENGKVFSCSEKCRIPSHEPHDVHICAKRECPIQCQLCKRLCSSRDHLHALEGSAVHLCGQSHSCSALCSARGTCQIETTPQSVEATFTGRHQTFQYTKYTQDAKRLPCVKLIPAGEIEHSGPHLHSLDDDTFHFCEARCENCGYFCTLRLGHAQQEHDTSHGSMSRTQWSVDGPDGTALELDGRRFGTNDDGAPMLCSLFCRSMGRHVHIDFCRTDPTDRCEGPEHEHITARMQPRPAQAKDWVSHSLYWRRTGFKDPYPHEDQNNFGLCDSMCPGSEHTAAINGTIQPSFCTLPILHPRQTLDQAPPPGGYISQDGHAFRCRNPAVMQQAFHVIFAIDRSGSMAGNDRRPLRDRPNYNLIARRHDNRLGAVYHSLYAFWSARHTAVTASGSGPALRRDAYTVLLFDHAVTSCLVHDFSSSPDQLLTTVMAYTAGGGTNFTAAIKVVQTLMERHWSAERSPVVIFLSDGECGITDEKVQNLCLRSTALGKPLSFHAVSFGPRSSVLQRMAQVAADVQNRSPPDPAHPVPPSSYAEALDSIHLAETFLGLAESLRKPRGSLMRA